MCTFYNYLAYIFLKPLNTMVEKILIEIKVKTILKCNSRIFRIKIKKKHSNTNCLNTDNM